MTERSRNERRPVRDTDIDEHGEIAERNLRILEAILFASSEPLSVGDIAPYLGRAPMCRCCSCSWSSAIAGAGVNLVQRGDRWAFRTADDLSFLLRREETGEPAAVARGAGDAGHHRLPPAGDAGRGGGGARRGQRRRDVRRADADRLGADARARGGRRGGR